MAARIGNALYWIGSGIAVMFFLAGIVAIAVLSVTGRPSEGLIIFAACSVIGLLVWCFGRACRYLLTEE